MKGLGFGLDVISYELGLRTSWSIQRREKQCKIGFVVTLELLIVARNTKVSGLPNQVLFVLDYECNAILKSRPKSPMCPDPSLLHLPPHRDSRAFGVGCG